MTLPDKGEYCLWVQASSGPFVILPVTIRNRDSLKVRIRPMPDQTLVAIKTTTGRMATAPIHMDAEATNALPIALIAGDFTPFPTAPNVVGDDSSTGGEENLARPRSTVVALGHADASTDTTDANIASSAKPSEDEWLTPIGTFFMGMALAGAVCWFLVRLMRRSSANAYEYSVKEAPVWRGDEPEASAPSRKERQRYRVTKNGGRGSRRRALAHIPQLIGTDGLAAGARFVLSTPTVSIGRDGDNEIVLAETKVSRRHARIERGMSGYITLIDEASANGVYVNGTRVEKAVLHQGDEIKIGDSFFRYEE